MEYVRDRGSLPCLPPAVGCDSVPLVRPLVATLRVVCAVKLSRATANPITLPKPKPRALRVQVIVPSIYSRQVASTKRSGVRHREDAL